MGVHCLYELPSSLYTVGRTATDRLLMYVVVVVVVVVVVALDDAFKIFRSAVW